MTMVVEIIAIPRVLAELVSESGLPVERNEQALTPEAKALCEGDQRALNTEKSLLISNSNWLAATDKGLPWRAINLTCAVLQSG